jgi:hypothetical protein
MEEMLHVCDLELEVSTLRLVQVAFEDPQFYHTFLSDIMGEKDLVVTEWKNVTSTSELKKYERLITSMHPLPLQLPWLPPYVHSSLNQTLEYNHTSNFLRVTEVSHIKGLPFIEPSIITEWDVVDLSPESCTANIRLRFGYAKKSWLQGMVESNSHSEMIRFFEEWQLFINDKFKKMKELGILHESTELQQLVELLPDPEALTFGSPERLRAQSFTLKTASCTSPSRSLLGSMGSRGNLTASPPSTTDYISSRKRSLSGGHVREDTISTSVAVHRLMFNGTSTTHYQEAMKMAIDGVCEYGIFKLFGAVVLNFYTKLNMADFHGIRLGHAGRTLLDHTASISLIYCFIVFLEAITRGVLTMIRPLIITSPTVDFGRVSRGTQTEDDDYHILLGVVEDEFSEDEGPGETWRDSGVKLQQSIRFSNRRMS